MNSENTVRTPAGQPNLKSDTAGYVGSDADAAPPQISSDGSGSTSATAEAGQRAIVHPSQNGVRRRDSGLRQPGRRRQPGARSAESRRPRWYWIWTYNREHFFVRAFSAKQAREIISGEAAALEAAEPYNEWWDAHPKGCHRVSRDLGDALDLGLVGEPHRVRIAPGVAQADAEHARLVQESRPGQGLDLSFGSGDATANLDSRPAGNQPESTND